MKIYYYLLAVRMGHNGKYATKRGFYTRRRFLLFRKLAKALLLTNSSLLSPISDHSGSSDFCNQSKAARILGISKSTLYRRCSNSCPENLKFPFKAKRVGRKLRFFIPELTAYLRDK